MNWLTGKKTYFGAAALALTAVGGFWFGSLDANTMTALLSAALITVGLGHKFDRYLDMGVILIENAKAQQAAKSNVMAIAPAGTATQQ